MSCFRICDRENDQRIYKMEPTVNFRKLSWIPVWQCAVLGLGTFVSYLVAYAHGSVTIYLPFISETGAKIPEICIFSYTLIIGSFFGVLIVCYRYIVLKHVLSRDQKILHRCNKVSLVCGLVSMAGLAGVAAVPMSTVLWLHLTATTVHFSSALLFIFIQTYINYFLPPLHTKFNKIRMGICVCLLALLFVLVIIFPLSHVEWWKLTTKAPAQKMPEDPGFALLFSAAIFEWLSYGTFLLFMLTFFFDFHNFKLMITVVPINEEMES